MIAITTDGAIMETMEKYVMQYPDGTYVAVDKDSGGYPYPVKSWENAYQWNTVDDADRYRGQGSDFERFSIIKMTISVEMETVARAGYTIYE